MAPARRCKKQHLEMVLVLCCLGRHMYLYPGPRRYRSTSRAAIAARDLRYARLDTPKRAPLRASIKRKPKNSCELSSTSSRAGTAPRRAAASPFPAHERVAHRCDAAAMDRLRSLAQRARLSRNVSWVDAKLSPNLGKNPPTSRWSNMAEFALCGSSFYSGDATVHGVLPFCDDRYLVHSVSGPQGRNSPPVHGVRKRVRRQYIKPPSSQVYHAAGDYVHGPAQETVS